MLDALLAAYFFSVGFALIEAISRKARSYLMVLVAIVIASFIAPIIGMIINPVDMSVLVGKTVTCSIILLAGLASGASLNLQKVMLMLKP